MLRNYKMVLQYDGSRYDGWQKQGNTKNTIQGKLESVLSRYFGQPVEVAGSGRTDAGVHAFAQTANFKISVNAVKDAVSVLEADELCVCLNSFLPEDIRILHLQEADLRFHARLNAKEKEYRYYISLDRKKDVFGRRYTAQFEGPESPDIESMKEAALYLTGEHDFAGFCDGRSSKSTKREIYQIGFERTKGMLGEGDCLMVSFRGNGFLYHMVRLMMGTLMEIGCHRADKELILEILTEKDRKKVPKMAPAQGLFLYKVIY